MPALPAPSALAVLGLLLTTMTTTLGLPRTSQAHILLPPPPPPSTPRRQDEPVACAPLPSPSRYPTWEELPVQTTMPDPFLPLLRTTLDNVGGGSAAGFAEDVMAGRAAGRVQSPEEWYRCRRPELLQLLQAYQYGYYPDHAQETVRATRSGGTLTVEVEAGGRTGRFTAQLSLPAGATADSPAPVVINIGGMQSQPYLQAGIAVVGFDYTAVAPDSNAKTGAFWALYNGRDIGAFPIFLFGLSLSLSPALIFPFPLLVGKGWGLSHITCRAP